MLGGLTFFSSGALRGVELRATPTSCRSFEPDAPFLVRHGAPLQGLDQPLAKTQRLPFLHILRVCFLTLTVRQRLPPALAFLRHLPALVRPFLHERFLAAMSVLSRVDALLNARAWSLYCTLHGMPCAKLPGHSYGIALTLPNR